PVALPPLKLGTDLAAVKPITRVEIVEHHNLVAGVENVVSRYCLERGDIFADVQPFVQLQVAKAGQQGKGIVTVVADDAADVGLKPAQAAVGVDEDAPLELEEVGGQDAR